MKRAIRLFVLLPALPVYFSLCFLYGALISLTKTEMDLYEMEMTGNYQDTEKVDDIFNNIFMPVCLAIGTIIWFNILLYFIK